jgi:Tol biopolymer transport system component
VPVSVAPSGSYVDAELPLISGNGRYVAFMSRANGLPPRRQRSKKQVFLWDRRSGSVALASIGVNGREPTDANSWVEDMSRNGRYLLFGSISSQLVRGDTNRYCRTSSDEDDEPVRVCGPAYDLFVRDRVNETTRRVSVSSSGRQAEGFSGDASISANGRFVAFVSTASNLVARDGNGVSDVFLHDRRTQRTRRVSVTNDGHEANLESDEAEISGDGRVVAFTSEASNLVAHDSNGTRDLFVRVLRRRATTRVSVLSDGNEAQSERAFIRGFPQMSHDGRWLAFRSAASVVPGDTNDDTDVFIHDRREHVTRRASVTRQRTTGQRLQLRTGHLR